MEKLITGKAFVVGDHVDTDQIIPAEYLSYNPADPQERKFFGRYAMSGVPAEQAGLPGGHQLFTPEDAFTSVYGIIIGGENFGCGSSREHAPLAIAEAGCRAVVASSFARIFYRNCVNGGYCAPLSSKDRLVEAIATGDELELDMESGVLSNLTRNETHQLEPLGDAAAIIDAGGIFNYARKVGMLEKPA
jgi:3-isopropylmalate/(R)-2-methylmalate dehydratase small subunit